MDEEAGKRINTALHNLRKVADEKLRTEGALVEKR